jgi:hypothetical protein
MSDLLRYCLLIPPILGGIFLVAYILVELFGDWRDR